MTLLKKYKKTHTTRYNCMFTENSFYLDLEFGGRLIQNWKQQTKQEL